MAASPAQVRKREAIADRLLRTQRMIASELLKIDEDKEALRAICEEAGEGFTVEVGGLGTVEVKAGHPKELTGTRPELVVAGYLTLGQARQKKLVEDGIVEIAEVWKKAAKPSVTVRL